MALAVEIPRKEAQPETGQDISSLRSTLDWLRAEGNLLETDVEVDPDLEITGIQKHFDGSLPILFNNVKGYPHARVVTNFFANMDIPDRLFGWDGPKDRTRKLAYALTHPIPPVEIPQAEATCQEEVITDDLDVWQRQQRRRRGLLPRWEPHRVQPHELPLGQRLHVPGRSRLPHVADHHGALSRAHFPRYRPHDAPPRDPAHHLCAGRSHAGLQQH